MLAKQWRRVLKSENKSERTIITYLYAVRIPCHRSRCRSEVRCA
jgi:hypothetical protein